MAHWLYNFVKFENNRWNFIFDYAPLRNSICIDRQFAPFSSYENLHTVRDPIERLKDFVSFLSAEERRFWNFMYGSTEPTIDSI